MHQCFIASKPNDTWVSDITYVRTHEGWIYLATVIDLYSRKIIGWATGHRQTTTLIIKALQMASRRLGKNSKVILHSDQGSQYSSYEYKQFAKKHNIILSMSRRGNCYDNAVAESFFKTFKKELVRKQVFLTREIAASKIFEYIEMFYNPKRRHSYLGYISPNEFEKRYNEELEMNLVLADNFFSTILGSFYPNDLIYYNLQKRPFHALIASYEGKKLILSEIENVAAIITKYYRVHGYFVARAYIPAQDVLNDTIKINIIEGKYGKFDIVNSSLVKTNILHGYLDPIKQKEAMYYPDLERKLLLINSLSGVKIVSADIHPGKTTGESDFVIKTAKTQRARAYLMGDNYGNVYTGEYRATAGLVVNSPLGYGDSLNAGLIRSTTGDLSSAQLGYTTPLGYSGLKANIFGSVTKYSLSGEYESLNAYGHAGMLKGGLSYPLILSQRHSLDVGMSFTSTRAVDHSNDTESVKHVNALRLALDDTYTHKLFGKAAEFQGSVSLTRGKVFLDNATAITNDAVLNSAGDFTKADISAKEKLYIYPNYTLGLKLSGQNAFGKNLDSSQQFSIGGADGVRAYTTGELFADKALLFSLDLDRSLPSYKGITHQAGIFFDTAYAWINSVSYTSDNTRQLSDIGISYKANYKNMFLSASFAHGFGVDARSAVHPTSHNNKVFIQIGAVF